MIPFRNPAAQIVIAAVTWTLLFGVLLSAFVSDGSPVTVYILLLAGSVWLVPFALQRVGFTRVFTYAGALAGAATIHLLNFFSGGAA